MGPQDQSPTTQNVGAVVEIYAQELARKQQTVIVQTVIIQERDEMIRDQDQTIAEQAATLDELRQEIARLTADDVAEQGKDGGSE